MRGILFFYVTLKKLNIQQNMIFFLGFLKGKRVPINTRLLSKLALVEKIRDF